MLDVAIIGGGAAGFFAAINIKCQHPNLKVAIFEKSKTVLGKVSISGGGRCNVTHSCFDNSQLISYYPRGNKELLTVFNRFNPQNTIQWFKQRNINLKTESDGRMFPESNQSETIINCFLSECKRLLIPIYIQKPLLDFHSKEDMSFNLFFENETVNCHKLVFTSGSSEYMWNMLKKKGIPIIQPVPSLYTFNIKHPLIIGLQGLSVKHATVSCTFDKDLLKKHQLKKNQLSQLGPLLITHWGLSGPAVLKLSSIGARIFNDQSYQFSIQVNWINDSLDNTIIQLKKLKESNSKKKITNTPFTNLPSRLWESMCALLKIETKNWGDLSQIEINKLAIFLTESPFEVNGKSTFKEEFVTAGGIDLKAVDFKSMQSKQIKNLFFAGEVLNIDALTGGFNFQAAWSEAWIISQNIA
jgi:predicted Rossmann fold flavoprotein